MRLLNSKKSMSFKLMLGIIMMIILILVLIPLFVNIYEGTEKMAYDAQCRASVMAYSKINSLPVSGESASSAEIDCPTRFLSIPDDRPLEMNRDIANLLYNCWNNYGEGEILLFRQTEQKFCALCSVFDFEDRSGSLSGFIPYIATERIPTRLPGGTRPTYYEYINGAPFPEQDFTQYSSHSLDKSKKYMVAYTSYRDSFLLRMQEALRRNSEMITVGTIISFVSPLAGGISFVGITAGAATAAIILDEIGWESGVILTEYSGDSLLQAGCENLPVRMIPREYRP
ncbi:hypothetical protein HQ545_01075 [Candidatus Woesearchaeota archaeon]|nr:hypothetical protein [Candidatus Woesearchaeota archaeon]